MIILVIMFLSLSSFSQNTTCLYAEDIGGTSVSPGQAFYTVGNIDLIQAPNSIENSYWKMFILNTKGWLDIGLDREKCSNKELVLNFHNLSNIVVDGDTFNLEEPTPNFYDKIYSFSTYKTNPFNPVTRLTIKGDFDLTSVIGNYNGTRGALEDVCLKTNDCPANSFQDEITRNINFYPNPTDNIISLETKEDSQLNIYSIEGKLLQSTNLNKGKSNINLSLYGKGNFILETISTNGRKTAISTVK